MNVELTAHPCKTNEQHRCEGTECDDNGKGERDTGVFDQDEDGCVFN